MRKNVAVVAGGYSAESEISLKSAATVMESIDRNRYSPILVEINSKEWFARLGNSNFPIDKNEFSFNFDGELVFFDYAFIVVHGTPGEDGKLQAYFDLLNIPYSSPNHIGATLTFNKWYCNTLLNQLGFATASSIYLRHNDSYLAEDIIAKLGIPCFVKPCSAGSSYGVTKVKDMSGLHIAIQKAFEFDREIMIESLLDGIELTCGVYKDMEGVKALPITQIIPKGEFFDYAAKYEGDSQEITPARIPDEAYQSVQHISEEIYSKLDLQGLVRIDLMLVGEKAFIIEINAVPGLSKESIIPQQLQTAKISLGHFFNTLIDATLK